MHCTSCGAQLAPLPPGSQPLPCPFCRAPVQPSPAIDPRLAAYLVDRNGNGVPDVLEGPGAAQPGLYRAAPAPVLLEAIPPAPRTPSPRARSLVYGYRGAQGVMLTIGLAFLGMGLLFTTIFCWGLPWDLALAASGARGQATVTSTETVNNVKVNGVRPTRLSFRYRVGPTTYDGDSATLDGMLRRTAVGATVPIEYLAFAPSISRVVGTTRATMGYTPIFVVIFPVVGAVLAFGAWRSNRREIRAFSRGAPVLARITFRGADMSVTVNHRHPFKIVWEFQVGGRPYSGSFSTMQRGELGGIEQSEQLAVLYDPRDPSVNTLWIA